MSDIKWEDPPSNSRGRGSTKWRDIFAALRSRPGNWALVHPDASASLAADIKNGRLGGAERGEFEARSVITNKKRARIYARYVGADVAD